jgi:hypothetical protein
MAQVDDLVLNESQTLLEDLFEELKKEESVLAGGQVLGIGAQMVQALRQSAVSFGSPYDKLIQLTPALLRKLDLKLDPIQATQMENQYDFYHMTLTNSLYPKRGHIFKRIECRLDFRNPGSARVIVQSLFPEPRYREVLEWGGSLNLALTGNLDWDIGVDASAVEELKKLGASAAKLKTNNEIGSRIVVPDFTFNMGRAEIAATGKGNDHCMWRMEQPELKESQTVQYIVIFKVSKGSKTIELEGQFICEPDMEVLTTSVDNVFSELSEKFKSLFRKSDRDRNGVERLPIGSHELWVPFELPLQTA